MSIASNLRRLRKKAGLSQTGLAELSNVSQQLISQIERGENRSTKELPALAEALGCDVADIDPAYSGVSGAGSAPVEAVLFPWLDIAALLDDPCTGSIDPDSFPALAVSGLDSGQWYATAVPDDGMDRIAPAGSLIIFNRLDRDLVHDRFYLFLINGAPAFRRFRAGEPSRLQPFSTNPDHETVLVDDSIAVIGRVYRVLSSI